MLAASGATFCPNIKCQSTQPNHQSKWTTLCFSGTKNGTTISHVEKLRKIHLLIEAPASSSPLGSSAGFARESFWYSTALPALARRHAVLRSDNHLPGDKMNLTVRLGKLFYWSSTGVPASLPCSQLPRQARGTVTKLFT